MLLQLLFCQFCIVFFYQPMRNDTEFSASLDFKSQSWISNCYQIFGKPWLEITNLNYQSDQTRAHAQSWRARDWRKRILLQDLAQGHLLFSSPEWKAQVSFSVCLLCVVHPSVYFSHFHLLENHRANFNQTWYKASFGDWDSSLFKWMVPSFAKGR